jgi:imidazolonepropionase-like amidohydrolase
MKKPFRAAAWSLLLTGWLVAPPPGRAQEAPVVLQTSTVLDGRGGVLRDQSLVIRDGRISEIVPNDQAPAGIVYDLRGRTLLPGLIDTHVHITWHFDRETGKFHSQEVEETPAQAMLYAVENAYTTLLGGVTTVQSLGAAEDKDLRDWINRGVIPGPRILTSLASISERTGTPEQIRQAVRERAAAGADVIKIFASASIRVGGTPTMTQEQLDAACGEAKRLGLRSAVHAHSSPAAQRAVQAGCTVIEHGALLDRETLELIAASGTFFDPNIDLVTRNYLENREKFLGTGGSYTAAGFEEMERAMPLKLSMFREALEVPGLKIIFGTDAVAGAFGRQQEELVFRVEKGGQDPMQAVISATSLAAESLGLQDRLGAVSPGMQADLIAVDGDPLQEIVALNRVVFVMREGKVYKYVPGSRH